MLPVARRRTTMLAVALLVALAGAACGDGGTQVAPPGPSSPVPAKAIDPNLDLKVGLGTDTYVLSGVNANLGANVNIVEGLVYLSPSFEPKPLLAERWELLPKEGTDDTRTRWRFYLRRGVTFHDGRPLDAQAVKEGLFDRVAKLSGGGAIKAGPSSVEIVDPFTITFTPTVPNLRVPEQLVHPATGAVVAPGTTMESRPVGTGPFRFVEYKTKESLVVERNPDYWGPKAAASKVTFRFFADPTTRLLALRGGELDVAVDVPRPDVTSLKQAGYEVVPSPVGSYQALYVNRNGILADPDARLAVAQAIDRKGLVDGVFEGLASSSQTMVPAGALGKYAGDVKGVAHDPAGAGALLTKAGWIAGPDGIRRKGADRLELTLVSGFPSSESLKPTPAYLQQELRKVGIDLKIVEVPNEATFNATMNPPSADLWLEQGSQNDGNPAFLLTTLLYTGNGGTAETRRVAALGKPFDDLLTPVFGEPDLDKVRASAARALQLVIDQERAVVPLAGIYRMYATTAKVQGLTPHPAVLNMRWAEVGLTSR